MSATTLLQPLYDILAQAEALSSLGDAQNWEALETELVSYQQKVSFLNDDRYLKAVQDEQLTEEAKEIIARIQVLNDKLDLHANDARDKIASELRQMIQSNKAIDAYGR